MQASDGNLAESLSVLITVTHEDEAGNLTLSSVQPQVDTRFVATLTDPRRRRLHRLGLGAVADNERTWQEIKGIRVAGATYTPVADDVDASLRVTATYTDETGAGKHAQIIAPYTVRTAPVNNKPPEFTTSTAILTVGVNAGAGSRVGAPVTAEDPEDYPLTYTLDGPDAASFSIDCISGQIMLGPEEGALCTAPETMSVEAGEPKTAYEVTVIATDPSGESDEIPVFITVGPTSSPPPPRGGGPPGGGGSPGGGGGGGGTTEEEDATAQLVGTLENPGPAAFQSGIGVISGWVCEAETVEIEIAPETGEPVRYVAGYGTERLDTARRADGTPLCGDTDNGFGLLFNWNRLEDGEHTVAALVDGIELGRATVTVTTLGAEFLRDVAGTCAVDAFPSPGETVTLVWQQTSQNFVLTDGAAPSGGQSGRDPRCRVPGEPRGEFLSEWGGGDFGLGV